jgi:hypothetical protein
MLGRTRLDVVPHLFFDSSALLCLIATCLPWALSIPWFRKGSVWMPSQREIRVLLWDRKGTGVWGHISLPLLSYLQLKIIFMTKRHFGSGIFFFFFLEIEPRPLCMLSKHYHTPSPGVAYSDLHSHTQSQLSWFPGLDEVSYFMCSYLFRSEYSHNYSIIPLIMAVSSLIFQLWANCPISNTMLRF